uniref:(northern house mosquito) hypothetical protein n=1 Tax=Culex pipiens TaxID=7175 RepID=A0A8D8ER12_CULPI
MVLIWLQWLKGLMRLVQLFRALARQWLRGSPRALGWRGRQRVWLRFLFLREGRHGRWLGVYVEAPPALGIRMPRMLAVHLGPVEQRKLATAIAGVRPGQDRTLEATVQQVAAVTPRNALKVHFGESFQSSLIFLV